MTNKKINYLVLWSIILIFTPIIAYYFLPHELVPTYLKNDFLLNVLAGINTMGLGALFTYYIIDQHYKSKIQQKYNKLINYIIDTLTITINNVLDNFIWDLELDEKIRNEILDKIQYKRQIGKEHFNNIEESLELKIEKFTPPGYISHFIEVNGWNFKKMETISSIFFNIIEEQLYIDSLSKILLDITNLYELTLKGKKCNCIDSRITKKTILSLINNIINLRDLFLSNI